MKITNKKIDFTFKKFKLGNVILRNRIISSPISINMANRYGHVSKNIISFFSNLGNSGVGMVTIGAASVSQEGNDTKNGMVVGGMVFGLEVTSFGKNGMVAEGLVFGVFDADTGLLLFAVFIVTSLKKLVVVLLGKMD